MTRIVLLMATLCSVACAGQPATPGKAPIVQRVEIPVPVSCIEQIPARPQLITDAELMELQPGQFVTALHVDRLKLDSYRLLLESIIEACHR